MNLNGEYRKLVKEHGRARAVEAGRDVGGELYELVMGNPTSVQVGAFLAKIAAAFGQAAARRVLDRIREECLLLEAAESASHSGEERWETR